MTRKFRFSFPLALIVLAALSGCATSGGASAGSQKFANLLVIGVAGSLDSRA